MPNLCYVDIYGFNGDCVCVRVVLKLIEGVIICLYKFFPQNPKGCGIVLAKAKNFAFLGFVICFASHPLCWQPSLFITLLFPSLSF